jgi:aldehyde:ferredoxin oxidoreductase
VIKGKSAKPVYLAIIDGKYELRDAAHLMGKLTGEVDDIIHKEVDPKAEILQHGIGAENGVLFSSLCSMSNRHNGRTGMGLVMAAAGTSPFSAGSRARNVPIGLKSLVNPPLRSPFANDA